MRIVCISDTHLAHETAMIKIPDGDILIHAGDGTHEGTVQTREVKGPFKRRAIAGMGR